MSVFEAAVETFGRHDDQPLSFTDSTTVALVEHHDIDCVFSFDDDFDGLVDRLDPVEQESVRRDVRPLALPDGFHQ